MGNSRTVRLMVMALMLCGLTSICVRAGVDTLKSTADIEDAVIYSYENCDRESSGEDCRRFNAGGLTLLPIGNTSAGEERRALFRLPGWDGVMPDSSKFLLYCTSESDAVDRKLFLYPLTVRIYEGNEVQFNLGDYPDPDSGVTWYHAYLDVGDGDSSNFSTPGGDYTTAVACTTTITGSGQYFSFDHFNRILNYWDTSSQDYGLIVINQNAFPGNTSSKIIRATESSSSELPLVLLYTAGETRFGTRRRRVVESSLGQ